MPLKKGSSRKATSTTAGKSGAVKQAKGGVVLSKPKGTPGPAMIVKKRDGNNPVKIY